MAERRTYDTCVLCAQLSMRLGATTYPFVAVLSMAHNNKVRPNRHTHTHRHTYEAQGFV